MATPNIKVNVDFSKVKKNLEAKKKKLAGGSVIVGYTANYALYVHENVGAFFKAPNTQAKFLEEPARRYAKDIGTYIARQVKVGKTTLIQAMFNAGLLLQREAMKITPIDTGNLRASATTRIERKN